MITSAQNAEASGLFEVPNTVDEPPPPRCIDPEETVRLPLVDGAEPSVVVHRRLAFGF